MRIALVASAVVTAFLAASPAFAQSGGKRGLMIDVKPRSWLDAGTSVPVGYGRDYVTNTAAFGGAPTNGISSRGEMNLPGRGTNGGGFVFDFMGANAAR